MRVLAIAGVLSACVLQVSGFVAPSSRSLGVSAPTDAVQLLSADRRGVVMMAV